MGRDRKQTQSEPKAQDQALILDPELRRKFKKFLSQEANRISTQDQRTIKKLQRQALILWKRKVKERAGRRCEACGKTKRLNAHHIESYSVNKALRYDIHNGLSLCPTCHKFGRLSAHRSFCFLYELLNRPERRDDLEYLLSRYRDKSEVNKEFLEQAIVNLLQIEAKAYEGGTTNETRRSKRTPRRPRTTDTRPD